VSFSANSSLSSSSQSRSQCEHLSSNGEIEAGGLLSPKSKFALLEKRIDEFCSFCEKVVLRALLFGCFIYEAGKFLARMLQK
jgi:hypothetical protein